MIWCEHELIFPCFYGLVSILLVVQSQEFKKQKEGNFLFPDSNLSHTYNADVSR